VPFSTNGIVGRPATLRLASFLAGSSGPRGQTQFIVVDGWIGGKESPQSASLIFAGYGITFSVTEDWAAEPSAHGYVAIGSGREQAVGAMCALNSYFKETHTEPIDLTQAKLHCQLAVDAACRHDVFCRGPVDILTVQRGEL
jgi:20S proteasome alpha/beta subunit